MAEQFVLKGVNRLVDYKSSGAFTFLIKNDPRGGDTWQIPQWWAKKANNTIYNSCTVIDLVGTNYVMIIPSSVDTQLMVTYDDDVYNIGFTNFSAVDRVAITSKDQRKIVVEYLFPSISGGAIAKRILQASSTIGSFTITGKGAVDVGQSTQYQSNATPDASDAVYAWTVEQGGSPVAASVAEITAGADASGCTVSWKTAGSFDVKCTITSETATDSPQSDSRAVTCSTVNTVGTVAITGNGTPTAQKSTTYSTTVSGNNVNDLAYSWTVLGATATIANKTGANTNITFDAAGNATVQCIVSSASAPDNATGTKAVVIGAAKKIGTPNITYGGPTNIPAATATNFQCNTPNSNVADSTFAWSVTPSGGVTIAASGAEATNITFAAAGTYSVKCIVSSATASDSPQTANETDINVLTVSTIGNVSVSGPSLVDTLNIGKQFTASVSGDASNLTYVWSSTPSTGAVFANNQSNPVSVTFVSEETYTIACEVKDTAASDSPAFGQKVCTVEE